MPIHIEELDTHVQVVDPRTLLSPAVLAQIVEAVLARLEEKNRAEQAVSSETDLRSVIERQRSRVGG